MKVGQVPLIRKGPLTGKWYVITSYNQLPNGNIAARKKFDVTDQMKEILESEKELANAN